jgi:hypothetical protein
LCNSPLAAGGWQLATPPSTCGGACDPSSCGPCLPGDVGHCTCCGQTFLGHPCCGM